MSELQIKAERIKLARLLNIESEQLAFVDQLGVEHCRALRQSMSDALFDAGKSRLMRTANAGKLLPIPILAKIGEKVFGPLLCARVAGLFSVDRAVAISERMPDEFQADISMQMDPRSARDLIANMPLNTIVTVAKILARRREYITAARFVDFLPNDVVAATINVLAAKDLLQIGFYIESTERLQEIIELLDDQQIEGLVSAANEDQGQYWAQIFSVMECLQQAQQMRLAEASLAQTSDFLLAMVRSIDHQDLWSAAIATYAGLGPEIQARFLSAGLRAGLEDESLELQELLEMTDRSAFAEVFKNFRAKLDADELAKLNRLSDKHGLTKTLNNVMVHE